MSILYLTAVAVILANCAFFYTLLLLQLYLLIVSLYILLLLQLYLSIPYCCCSYTCKSSLSIYLSLSLLNVFFQDNHREMNSLADIVERLLFMV